MLVVCAGTATEVGKTWVGATVLAELRRRGRSVSARKPAQSFDPADDHLSDAAMLAAATGEPVDVVCPPDRSYPVPMAPPMAAAALGRSVPGIDELVSRSPLGRTRSRCALGGARRRSPVPAGRRRRRRRPRRAPPA